VGWSDVGYMLRVGPADSQPAPAPSSRRPPTDFDSLAEGRCSGDPRRSASAGGHAAVVRGPPCPPVPCHRAPAAPLHHAMPQPPTLATPRPALRRLPCGATAHVPRRRCSARWPRGRRRPSRHRQRARHAAIRPRGASSRWSSWALASRRRWAARPRWSCAPTRCRCPPRPRRCSTRCSARRRSCWCGRTRAARRSSRCAARTRARRRCCWTACR
jgi:hypothetical protein